MKPFLTFTAISCLATIVSLAALPPRAPEDLDKSADLIIHGKVLSADVSTEGTLNHSNWIVLLKVEIEKVDKGEGKPSDSLEIHCWRLKKRPNGWVGPSGHYSIPAVGSTFKMWLRKSDEGEWAPLAPNGINLPEGEKALDFQSHEKPKKVAAIAATAVGGVLIGAVFAIVRQKRATDLSDGSRDSPHPE